MFTSFYYVVGNSFVFKNERKVDVFFIYNYKNIILPLTIKKAKNHEDEQYYINEAKKIVDQKIKDGSLESYTKKYLKEVKIKNIVKMSTISLAGACAIAGASFGINYAIELSKIHKFTFTGERCKINNSYSYTNNISENDTNVQYTIVADDKYTLPETIEGDVDYVKTTSQAAIITLNGIKGDVKVTVKADVTLTVTFDANGGELTDDTTNPVKVMSNEPVLEKYAPKLKDRPGYDKNKVTWINKETGELFTFGDGGTLVTKDTFLKADWGALNQFTVNFCNDDGEPYDSLENIKVNYGDKVLYKDCPLDDTYDKHYTFDEWYDRLPSDPDAKPFSFDKPLEGDIDKPINIYAKHSKKIYHVTFDANGGELISGGDPVEVPYLGKVDVSNRPDVKRSGYAPTRIWCTDKAGLNQFTFGVTQIKDHTTLYAQWTPVPSSIYTVTFDAGDGKFFTGQSKLNFDVAQTDIGLYQVIRAIDTPKLANNTFGYYTYEDGSSVQYEDIVEGNITLEAHYFTGTSPHTNLNSFSWQQIKDVAVTNLKPEDCFAIGATKDVLVDGNPTEAKDYTHTVKIIGFNHDKLVTSTEENPLYAGITFEFFDIVTEWYGSTIGNPGYTTYWDTINENNYKYSNSTLKAFLNDGVDSIFNKLEYTLKADGIIQEVYKPVAETADYTINNNYSDKLFPLSYYEMTGNTPSGVKKEGTQYEYWKSHNSDNDRIKATAEGGQYTVEETYWLRSPDTRNKDNAWVITQWGSPNTYCVCDKTLDDHVHDVAPGFCI